MGEHIEPARVGGIQNRAGKFLRIRTMLVEILISGFDVCCRWLGKTELRGLVIFDVSHV